MMLDKRSPYQEGSLWYYAPSQGAPISFAIMFAVSGMVHIYQCCQYKSWKVTGLLPWSALLFTAGFITRTIGAFGQWGNVGIYIASTVLLLAAPPVYEGANYFTLGRILYYIPYHSPIHPGRVFTTFVAVGVVIEAITGNGAALVANSEATEGKRKTGEGLLKAALILQLVLMAVFVALAARFHYNCSRGGVLNHKIKRALYVLYCSCTLITVRTIYRTVEYFSAASLNVYSGNQISPILKDEWFFWVFEAVVMYLNTILLNVCHPMQWLPRSNKIYLATDGVTEIEGPGYDDHRPVILTLIDPFDIVGLIKNKGRQEKYWEAGPVSKLNKDTPGSFAV
ncbi:RTA1 like protein-domain-containing protein [Aspergillus welwitschiae]|uniref:RTA1 like protein-domain-containing protein n=1 Tax=Aspergillus welwitschiae TaxID=1341132 RepID=A0A3F3Q404_9EURO|nr:RTA1 like protein-domain-containing protein [Aspergillus welwitschiae]RDH33913.1 RTA1 like protein-domain-containing protein [Aspergillus welwitschiae]